MGSARSIIEVENLLSKYSQYYDVEQKMPLTAFWEVLERYIAPFHKLQQYIPELTRHGTIEECILRKKGPSIHKESIDLLTIEAIAYKFESGNIPSATVSTLHRLVNSLVSKEGDNAEKHDELNTIYWCTVSIINFITHINHIIQNIKQSGVHLEKKTVSAALLHIHHTMLWIQKTNAVALAVKVFNKCAKGIVIDEAQALFVAQNIAKVIENELVISMVQHITLDVTVATQSIPKLQPLIDAYITKKKNEIDKFYSTHVDRERFAINQLIKNIESRPTSYLVAYSKTTRAKLQEIHIDLVKYPRITNNIYTYIHDILSHQISRIQLSLFVQADWKQPAQKAELGNILDDIRQLVSELKELDNRLSSTLIGEHTFMDYMEMLNYQSNSSTNKLLVSVKPFDSSAREIIEVFLALVELLSTNLHRLLIDYKADRRILANWRAIIEENSKFVESIEIVCNGLSNIHQIIWEEYSKIA